MALDPRACDIVSLELLASVAATGSISAAAHRQGLSQPAASSRLRELENKLGVGLLERGPHGTRPTAIGALVIEWSQPLLRAAATLQGALFTLRDRTSGRDPLRVAASTTIAEYLLPRWLGTLRVRRPETRAVLGAHNSAQVLRRLRAGTADLGFVEGEGVPPSLRTRTVAHDVLLLVVSPDHAWAARDNIAAPELAAAPLITREAGSGTRAVLDRALRACGASMISPPAMEVSSATAVKNAVVGGHGAGVLSSLAVDLELAAGTLIAVPTDLDLRRDLRAVWAPDRPLTTIAEALIDIASHPLP